MPTMLEFMPSLSFFDRMALGKLDVIPGHLDKLLIMRVQRFDFFLRKIFDIDQTIAGAFERCNDLVQLQVNRMRILVLRTLNKKDHQERYDRRTGVYYKLPRVRKMKQWPRYSPDNDHRQGKDERHRRSGRLCCLQRETLEELAEIIALVSHHSLRRRAFLGFAASTHASVLR